MSAALIALDWGTTNRRGWALSASGDVIDERADGEGLLSLEKDAFAPSFARFVEPWKVLDRKLPAIMCGMVGSKLGWAEASYLSTPVDLSDLARSLLTVQFDGQFDVRIVPGVSAETGSVPDVMRGEECQVLAVLAESGLEKACLVLPGTHSKWVTVADGKLTGFRTYMTGEIFNALSAQGTLAQLMEKGPFDHTAFAFGLERAVSDGALTHQLFGVRTLGLFGRLKRPALASYLSGLLIGAEFADAISWAEARSVIAVGSPNLLENYRLAAQHFGIAVETRDNSTLLPPALFAIARAAGLIR
jgi:2-dehydro-3-deoxygalactonokinase